MKAIALFGGSFNPIHYGHLAIAEEIRDRLGLEKVVFVPCFLPPHKDAADIAEAGHRAAMARLATAGNPRFEVSTLEIDRGGKSYTIDTVRHFKESSGEKAQIYFLVGADMLKGISTWKDIEGLLRICRIVVVPRPGYDLTQALNYRFLAAENADLATGLLENIVVQEAALLGISATDIRRRVREGKSIKYLLPDAVEQYIREQRLYLGG